MNINLENTDLQKLIDGAAIAALGAVGQEALVKEVIRHLTSTVVVYGKTEQSPLMRALQCAAESAARKLFAEKLENDEVFTAELNKLFSDVMAKVFTPGEDRDKVVNSMSAALSNVFRER